MVKFWNKIGGITKLWILLFITLFCAIIGQVTDTQSVTLFFYITSAIIFIIIIILYIGFGLITGEFAGKNKEKSSKTKEKKSKEKSQNQTEDTSSKKKK